MIIKNLQLKNFLSHLNTSIDFTENSKVIIEGPSGVGKSSIVEGIIWALYGRGRVENRNMVRRGAKLATVSLSILDGKKEYKIERSANTTGKHTLSAFEKKGKTFTPIKTIGLKDTQKWIENDILKSSYALFINSVAYPQDNVESFVKQPAGKRKELLLEIADINDFGTLYDQARTSLSALSLDIKENEVLFRENKDKEELVKNHIKKNEGVNKDTIKALLDKSKEISTEISDFHKKKDEIAQKREKISKEEMAIKDEELSLSMVKRDIEEIKSKIKEIEKIDPVSVDLGLGMLIDKKNQLTKLKTAQIEDFDRDMSIKAIIASKPQESDFEEILKSIDDQIIELSISDVEFCEYVNRPCPKLNKVKDEKIEHLDSKKKDILKQVEDQRRALKEYEDKLMSIPPRKKEEEEYKNEISKLEGEVGDLLKYESQKEELENLNVKKEELSVKLKEKEKKEKDINFSITINKENVLSKVKDLKLETEKLSKFDLKKRETELASINDEYYEKKSVLESIEKSKKELASLKSDNSKILKELKKMKYNEECLTLAKDAFGSKGIKTVVVDYIIPRLEYRINEILSKMSDFKIRLDSQKSKFDGDGVSEGLFINIYNETGEIFPLANYSGGQKLKITVAIAEALATMQRSKFRILDEPFTALDEDSLEGFNDVLRTLQDDFSQIFCISHLRAIQDSFQEKIVVEKRDGVSVVL